MSVEILTPESMSVRDQFLVIADNVRDLRLAEEEVLTHDDLKDKAWTVNVVREDNKPYVPPPAYAKLAVVAVYQGPTLSWQKLEQVNFGLIDEGYDWTVNTALKPELYEDDYSRYLLELTRARLDQPHSICVQAFQSYKVSSAMLAGRDVTGMHQYDESDGTNDRRGSGRNQSTFGSGSHLS